MGLIFYFGTYEYAPSMWSMLTIGATILSHYDILELELYLDEAVAFALSPSLAGRG